MQGKVEELAFGLDARTRLVSKTGSGSSVRNSAMWCEPVISMPLFVLGGGRKSPTSVRFGGAMEEHNIIIKTEDKDFRQFKFK
jgi:hypothetical protein